MEARSWVSSPLGVNLLLSMLKDSRGSHEQFLQKCHKLNEKSECRTSTKIFSIPDTRITDIFTDKKHLVQTECPRDAAAVWVRDNSEFKNASFEKKIPELAKVVLVNVSTFKSSWAHTNSAARMKIYNSFSYTQDVQYEARLIELPMEDRDFKLVYIAPNQVDLLHTLFRRLADQGLQAALCNIQPVFTVESKFQAPCMEFDSEGEINRVVNQLGDVIISQNGKSNINYKGVQLSVLSYLYVKWCDRHLMKPDLSQVEPPFFFCIVFQDTPIFTGQFNNETESISNL